MTVYETFVILYYYCRFTVEWWWARLRVGIHNLTVGRLDEERSS